MHRTLSFYMSVRQLTNKGGELSCRCKGNGAGLPRIDLATQEESPMLDMGRHQNGDSASLYGTPVAQAIEPSVCVGQGRRVHMDILSETAKTMAETIRALPDADVATLQSTLRQLDLDQFDFVYDVLECEVAHGRMTRNEFRRFESFVDHWWTHDLPMKLAFLNRVCTFINLREWPFQVFPELQGLRVSYDVTPCTKACRKLR